MERAPHFQTPALGHRGFTFVEMLVAISLSAVFLGAASIVLTSISANSKRLTRVVELDIGSSTKNNFYEQGGSTVQTYAAPNYGRAAYVQLIRDLMLEDASQSSAVFCLPRQLENTIRPEFLPFPAGAEGATVSRPVLDTPEAFRNFLATAEPTSAGIYDSAVRNIPPTNRPDTTIFMLAPETDPTYIRVRAIYEIDLVPVTTVAGIYASVRRYKNGVLTHYYDVFYDSGSGDPFYPAFATFERTARQAVTEGSAIDRFKIAQGNPFSLVWLPDPAINPLELAPVTVTDPATSPRAAYQKMTGKTSFVVALPMFPNL
ncbi:MAG: prepilin-type N-terminal cleavage/methylation domain-containing protein [Verrucomicrobiales bacterium]|nr:prepilin-type N-terminal cleavage/methylation domain-containing protein [Verrucomicrobiales bacterium]